MQHLSGMPLRTFPVRDLEWVKDLEYFDGPLLSQFRHRRRGDNYLYYWCDRDDAVNRWMVLRVSETIIIRLVNRLIPLNQVIPKACQDDFVYFVDMDAEGEPAAVVMLTLDAIPGVYVPEAGAYLSEGVAERLGWYSVLIERNLTIPNWRELFRDFSHVYSFLYNLIRLKCQWLKRHPWQGNFSSMHFWQEVADTVPMEDTPEVVSMQYASPGFIRYKLDSEIACRVGDAVSVYLERRPEVEEAIDNLAAYNRANKLNELLVSDDRWRDHNPTLRQLTRAVVDVMEIPSAAEFLAAARRPFEAAKMTLAYLRRVKYLADMETDRLVRFPSARVRGGLSDDDLAGDDDR